MLMWRGWGIVVVGIVLIAIFAAALVASSLHIGKDSSSLIMIASLIPAGIATWYVGKRLNRDTVRELIDPRTGEMVRIRSTHDLFFLRVEWWGLILTAFGIFGTVVLVAFPPTH
jgi:hypothetical protein